MKLKSENQTSNASVVSHTLLDTNVEFLVVQSTLRRGQYFCVVVTIARTLSYVKTRAWKSKISHGFVGKY